ncbi:MAG: HAMP domain-containing sensor histidine kinase [Candidatus Saccharibacteria bacterium]
MGATRGEHNKILDGPQFTGLSSVVAAAHELKSPLVLIRQLSLMLEDSDLEIIEKKRILQQISLTSEQALRLTSDLTRSARLSDALFDLEPINPQQLCEDIINELKPVFEARNHDVRLLSRKNPLLLIANRDLLRRIIINFSDNALHYSDSDNTIEIQIALHNSGNTVRLGVRDYGPTLPGDIMKSIKGRFFDKSMSINTRPQSSGLGLYIASQFADVMNGSIGVIRHRDGSTFYIDLQASRQLSLI